MVETGTTNEIGDLNLTYLLLAQRLVKEDVATAMFRMGMSRELADLLGSLSLSQTVKLAASSLLLCRFRFEDQPMLSALTHDGKSLALQQAHTASSFRTARRGDPMSPHPGCPAGMARLACRLLHRGR